MFCHGILISETQRLLATGQYQPEQHRQCSFTHGTWPVLQRKSRPSAASLLPPAVVMGSQDYPINLRRLMKIRTSQWDCWKGHTAAVVRTNANYTHRYATPLHVEQSTKSSQVYKVRAIIIPTLQMRTLRLAEVTHPSQQPMEPTCQNWDSHTRVPDFRATKPPSH